VEGDSESEPDSAPVEESTPEDGWQAAEVVDVRPEEESSSLPVDDDSEDGAYSFPVEESTPEDGWQAAEVVDARPEEEPSPIPVEGDSESEPDVAPAERAAAQLTTGVDSEPEYRDPDESVRLISLARLYRRQGDLDNAASVYRDLLETEPDNSVARRELGELCGDGLTEITDEDIIPSGARVEKAIQAASMETLADARRRKVAFLKSWLEHIRAQD
jgi:hypothetical protein